MTIDWNTVGAGLFMTVAGHPITYCKVLIQLGHEPLPAVIRRNMFFRNQLQYPGLYQYIKHIRQVDGGWGIFRGVAPRVCANFTASVTHATVNSYVMSPMNQGPNPNDDAKTVVTKIVDRTSREMVVRCCTVIVSHPFHVIAVRTMAQFVGQEAYYSGLISPFKEIYNEEGVLGFFSGLVPRLVAEIAQVWLCNILTYLLNNYVLNDQSELGDLRQYSAAVTSYIASSITYPLNLASTVVAVSGSRLAAGNPPSMEVYDGWLSCLTDLKKKGLASRGSSLFFRRVIKYAAHSTAITPMPPPPMPK